MRQIVFFMLVISLLFTGQVLAADAEPSKALEKVSLQLKWKHQFQFAGYYAAIAKGYYREAGLDVELLERVYGSERPVETVMNGRATYGIEGTYLLSSRMQGSPLVALAAVFQHSPAVAISLQKNSINTAKDMFGKRVMSYGGADVELFAMLMQEGIQARTVDWQPMSYTVNSLISGETDLYSGYLTNEPFFLEQQQIPYSIINPISYGIDFYSDILFTTRDEISEHPHRVKAFREASLRGWQYALQHPEEIVDLILSKYPSDKSREHLLFEARKTAKLIRPEVAPLGHINQGRIFHMAEVLKKLGRVEDITNLPGFIYEESSWSDLSAAESTWLSNHKSVRVLSTNSPPLIYDDGVNPPRGLLIDYLNKLTETYGIKLEFVRLPWGEGLESIGTVRGPDVLPALRPSPERSRELSLSQPYITLHSVIFTREQNGFIGGIEDLAGYKVGLQKGVLAAKQVKEKYPLVKIVEVHDDFSGLKQLVAGEVDAYIGNLLMVGQIIAEQGLVNLKVAAPFTLVKPEHVLGVRKDWPELVSLFDRVLSGMSPQEQAEIRSRWLSLHYEYGVTHEDLWLWGLGALVVIVLFSSIFMAWNRQLQKEIRRRKETEAFYQTTFDKIQAGVAHLARDGKITRVNPFMCEMLGYPASEMTQLTLHQLTHPEDLSISMEMLRQLQAGETDSFSLAKRYLKKDGSPVWGLVTVSQQVQPKGEDGYVVVVQDIDDFKHQQDEVTEAAHNLEAIIEQRTLELQLRVKEVETLNNAMMNLADDLQKSNSELGLQQEQLAETNAELESFAYSVSHDLRAPLRHISGFVSILRESSEHLWDEAARRHLETISRSADKMGQMIDNLLTFSRAGRAELVMAPIDMNLLFQEVRAVICSDYPHLDIAWQIDRLPQVHGDVSSLRQVVVNLLDNAVKYSSKNERPSIEVSSRNADGEFIFKIRDNGVGFDQAYEDKLFKVFHRLHRDDEFSGTGIGLASVRRIIMRHGGWVKGEARVGKGACFSFSLPGNI